MRNRGKTAAQILRGEVKVRDPGPPTKRWEHAGLVCMIRPGPPMLGFYNGYVAVPPAHAAYGLHYDKLQDVDVHGGLTYGELEPDGWVYGFDTGHAYDVWPEATMPEWLREMRERRTGIEWTLEKLEAEVNRLAEQLAAVRK